MTPCDCDLNLLGIVAVALPLTILAIAFGYWLGHSDARRGQRKAGDTQ